MLDIADSSAERLAMGLLAGLPGMLASDLATSFFPEDGPFARKHYPKHLEAFELSLYHDVISVFGGNRTGKTTALAYMARCWATGIYPWWWPGRVFNKPTVGWIASQTSATVTAGLQLYLFGPDGNGGLISRDSILDIDYSKGSMGMIHRALVKHEPTGLGSEIFFKTYDMGWKRFQTATIDYGMCDEEPPAKVYSEINTRSATTGGLTVIGFTALDGVTPLVAHLLPEYAGATLVPDPAEEEEENTKRAHVFIGWDDVPFAQISRAKRKSLAASYLPHERDARMKGIPQLGTGLVYPVGQEKFTCEPFPIPRSWPKLFAADPGGTPGGDGRTAGLWGAIDTDSGCVYFYSEHYERFAPIPSHVHAFAKRGSWIPAIIDPAGRNITDGAAVYAEYVDTMHELNPSWPVHKADKRFTAGRAALYGGMVDGSVKVFNTLRNTLAEHRSYIVTENGEFKGPHHLWDCARYIVMKLGVAALQITERAAAPITETRYFR